MSILNKNVLTVEEINNRVYLLCMLIRSIEENTELANLLMLQNELSCYRNITNNTILIRDDYFSEYCANKINAKMSELESIDNFVSYLKLDIKSTYDAIRKSYRKIAINVELYYIE